MPKNSRRGWQTSPPSSRDPHLIWPPEMSQPATPPPHHPPAYHVPNILPDLHMMLGRIAERTEATADRTERMEDRLTDIGERLVKGDARFQAIETRVDDMQAQTKVQPVSPPLAVASPSSPWAALWPAALKYTAGAAILAAASAGKLPWDVVLKLLGK